MKNQIANELIILYVLRVLENNTSNNKLLRQEDICNILNLQNIKCDRKNVVET